MNQEPVSHIRVPVARIYQQGRNWLVQLPAKGRIVLGLFLCAALFMALHTAFSGKDANLHLTVQYAFRNANISLWIDDDLAYSGTLKGTVKRKFGLIPASVQGSFSEILPISAGTHRIRVQVEPDVGPTQQDSLTGDFARDTERELSVSARPSGVSLTWRATNSSTTSGSGWIARYAGALFLSIGGSIVSALTGFALKELPAQMRSRKDADSKAQSTAAGL
jgi:hypothetical protein